MFFFCPHEPSPMNVHIRSISPRLINPFQLLVEPLVWSPNIHNLCFGKPTVDLFFDFPYLSSIQKLIFWCPMSHPP